MKTDKSWSAKVRIFADIRKYKSNKKEEEYKPEDMVKSLMNRFKMKRNEEIPGTDLRFQKNVERMFGINKNVY